MAENTTLEQQARDLLERAGIENAQSFTAGDLVEIANLLGRIEVQSAPAVREPAIKKPIGDQAATDTSSATTAMTAGSPAINGALPLGSDAMREPHEPYLCIKPACGPDCSGCNCAISPQDMRDYAVRYAILRNAPIDAIRAGGVFAGKTPDNVVLNGEHLDAAVDALRGITGDSK